MNEKVSAMYQVDFEGLISGIYSIDDGLNNLTDKEREQLSKAVFSGSDVSPHPEDDGYAQRTLSTSICRALLKIQEQRASVEVTK